MPDSKDPYSHNISETFVQFINPGDEVHGKLVSVSKQAMPSGDVGRYTVENDEGRYTFLGTVQVDHMLGGKRLGYDFKLVFKGLLPTGQGREVKEFDLFERE